MNLIDKFKSYLKSKQYIELLIDRLHKKIEFDLYSVEMQRSALCSNESGVTDELYCDYPLIVSLTTYGKRLNDVYLTIESILRGTKKPNRIILWLEESLENETLPDVLVRQMNRGLEIRYTKNILSFKKIIPTLKLCPSSIIVTIDDDVIYKFDMIERMFNSYLKEPKAIHANRVHSMTFSSNKVLNSYNNWDWGIDKNSLSIYNFATGVGGILYPPNSLNNEVFNEKAFMELCPYGDDIWLFAMGHLNGYYIKKVLTHDNHGYDYFENESVQDVGLNIKNTLNSNRNDIQIKAVFEKYNIYNILNLKQ